MTSPELSLTYFLTAGECDARGEMPMTLIAERIIEAATRHANLLGIGYADLAPIGAAWVLSRLSVRMESTPGINSTYTVQTWIESWNRLYSERCFRFADAEGRTIGFARTIWVTIDTASRRPRDITGLGRPEWIAGALECPVPRMPNHIKAEEPSTTREVTFEYSDIDFNRHVNSVRYISHILDIWPVRHYDNFRICGFDIAYRHECFADQTVLIVAETGRTDRCNVEVVRDDTQVVAATVSFEHSPIKNQ